MLPWHRTAYSGVGTSEAVAADAWDAVDTSLQVDGASLQTMYVFADVLRLAHMNVMANNWSMGIASTKIAKVT